MKKSIIIIAIVIVFFVTSAMVINEGYFRMLPTPAPAIQRIQKGIASYPEPATEQPIHPYPAPATRTIPNISKSTVFPTNPGTPDVPAPHCNLGPC